MSKDRILDRIKKLLSLSKSTNEHEAASAAAEAAKLMLEHQIAEAELEGDVGEPEPVTEEQVDGDGKAVTWKVDLLDGLGASLGCKVYYKSASEFYQEGARYYCVGSQSSLDTIRYMYQYLVGEVRRLADVGYKAEAEECAASGVERPAARAWKGSFRVGCARMIAKRLKAQRQETLSQANQEGRSKALVRIDSQALAVKDYMQRHHGRIAAARSTAGSGSRSGLAAGAAAGKGVNLGNSSGSLSAGARRLKS